MIQKLYNDIIIIKGWQRHPQSQGCVEHTIAPFKDALSIWMEENATDDWTMGAQQDK